MSKQDNSTCITVRNLNFSYRSSQTKLALEDISLDILSHKITTFMGPSGCGKSTLLRCFNRMNDLIVGSSITNGYIHINNEDIYAPEVDVTQLRKKIGMVFQRSNPFPKSIYENVAYGVRLLGIKKKLIIDEIVENSLKSSFLWDEVKDRLNQSAIQLSGGQQQRLCIARTIAIKPSIILMDEPCSALDPIASSNIEALILKLKKDFTIIVVTHNMEQASRVSDNTGFFHLGKLIEFGKTTKIFSNPNQAMTEDYIRGRFS